jgi:hypothetical protein
MSLIISQESAPTAPTAGKTHVFLDSTDSRIKSVNPDGSINSFSGGDDQANLIVNGGFLFAQRQTPATLTTYSNTTGRTYGLDRWGITNENASVQVARGDAADSPPTGLGSRHYARVLKITSAGKVILSQVVEGSESMAMRTRRVRVQFSARNVVGSHTLRCALIQLAAAGTVDTIPATFVSAFGSVGTDPTWGANLAAIVPTLANSFSSVSGSGLSCTLTSSFRRYGGVFVVPSDAKNLVLAIFTNNQMSAADEFQLADAGLYVGDQERLATAANVHGELERCQRFYSKTFEVDVGPVQNVGSVTGAARYTAPLATTGNQRSPSWNHPVRMRITPTTGALFNPSAANAQARDTAGGAGDCSGTVVQSLNDRSWAVLAVGNSNTAVGNVITVHATFDAEL